MGQGIDSISFNLLKKSLDATSERAKVIAQNISNVNTEGYKASRVIFEDKLNAAINNESFGLTTTHTNHIQDESSIADLTYDVEKDNSDSTRLDGNNVDIDNESANLAANTILYDSLISQANSRISMRRMVTEGK